jgi:hypothetical protein
MIYVSRLRFYEPFFPMWSSVYVLCWFSFSQPDVNITWITGHIHRSIVDKIDPTSEYVEMVKKIYIINYIGLHSFVKCDQKNLFNRKKYFWWTVTRTPPLPFFFLLTSKLEEWLMMKFLLENCLLDLFVVLHLDLGSILIDNSFFFVFQKLDLNIIYILFVFDNSMKNVIQGTCVDFCENIRS